MNKRIYSKTSPIKVQKYQHALQQLYSLLKKGEYVSLSNWARTYSLTAISSQIVVESQIIVPYLDRYVWNTVEPNTVLAKNFYKAVSDLARYNRFIREHGNDIVTNQNSSYINQYEKMGVIDLSSVHSKVNQDKEALKAKFSKPSLDSKVNVAPEMPKVQEMAPDDVFTVRTSTKSEVPYVKELVDVPEPRLTFSRTKILWGLITLVTKYYYND